MTCEDSDRTTGETNPNADAALRFDSSDDGSLTSAVVDAVSRSSDVDALELDPLYAAVDPDALAALFRSMSAAEGGKIEFTYSGRVVSIHDCGLIEVSPNEAS